MAPQPGSECVPVCQSVRVCLTTCVCVCHENHRRHEDMQRERMREQGREGGLEKLRGTDRMCEKVVFYSARCLYLSLLFSHNLSCSFPHSLCIILSFFCNCLSLSLSLSLIYLSHISGWMNRRTVLWWYNVLLSNSKNQIKSHFIGHMIVLQLDQIKSNVFI